MLCMSLAYKFTDIELRRYKCPMQGITGWSLRCGFELRLSLFKRDILVQELDILLANFTIHISCPLRSHGISTSWPNHVFSLCVTRLGYLAPKSCFAKYQVYTVYLRTMTIVYVYCKYQVGTAGVGMRGRGGSCRMLPRTEPYAGSRCMFILEEFMRCMVYERCIVQLVAF
jgi:hypothetical protein